MFSRQEEIKPQKEAETVIGSSVKLKGDFHGQGDIIIEGILDGSLKTTNNLFVGDKAKVRADIEAKDAKIGGEIKGNIKVKGHLEITSTAKIFGDIEVGSLSVARGAVINGKCTMGGFTESAEKIEKKEKPIV